MQALSSFPSPSSDTSNSQARAVLSKDEENMKSPVNKILRQEFYFPGGWLARTYFCILEVWPSYTKRHSQVVMSHFLMVESAPPVMT